ncbi:MAG: hypothetical protein AB202_01980 [Parcubacteria bacterium C7867-007]|nr:MAG: hypothetical protein AB202_01980 [Parcubacteria bacterium C7867-007]
MLVEIFRNAIYVAVALLLFTNGGATFAGYALSRERTREKYMHMEIWGRTSFIYNLLLLIVVVSAQYVIVQGRPSTLFWVLLGFATITVILSSVLVFFKKWADRNRLHRKVAVPYALIALVAAITGVMFAYRL